MSTPIHVLLKADLGLKGGAADDKVDPLVCLQLKSDICLAVFFLETAGSMDYQHVLGQAVFYKFLPQ